MEGINAGPVRAPLVDAAPEDVAALAAMLKSGRAVLADHLAAVR